MNHEDKRLIGFCEGFAAGEAAATAALLSAAAALDGATDALQAASAIDPAALCGPLAGLVRAIAASMLAAELRVGAGALMPLGDAALSQLARDATPDLRAHPFTLEAFAGRFAALAVQPDAAMPLDGFSIEGLSYVVQAEPAARLDEALAAIA